MKVWAFIRPDGTILADSTFATADDAWRVGLGYPPPEEIEEHKRLGYRVEQVDVTIRQILKIPGEGP
jgi:hypothetical protein